MHTLGCKFDIFTFMYSKALIMSNIAYQILIYDCIVFIKVQVGILCAVLTWYIFYKVPLLSILAPVF